MKEGYFEKIKINMQKVVIDRPKSPLLELKLTKFKRVLKFI